MRNIYFISILCIVLTGVFLGAGSSLAKTEPLTPVKAMEIKGEIAQMNQGYIIRGTAPAEIFTILNPNPEILDKYVKNGKIAVVSVRIVSGDNVEIQKIDGKDYP